MAKTEFFRCNGATERADKLVCLSPTNYLLIFGFDTDAEGNKYTWRKYYDYKPTIAEIKADVYALINQKTDIQILSSFVWNGKPVWLSTENQINFKAAYDLAFQTGGATLPVKFKLGDDSEDNPVYHTFQKIETFTDFYTKAVAHVNACISDGWKEKDSIDWSKFEVNE